jgi:hypothetical protein
MLHKVKSEHWEILKGLPELAALLPSSARKKRQLLDMARRGEPRPKQKTTIGTAFGSYTRKKSPVHDPDFTKEIRGTAPSWFFSPTEKVARNKRLLLEMARRGDPRPSQKNPLGSSLNRYANGGGRCYDPAFAKNIRRIAPHWFFSRSDVANRKKTQLLLMAQRKEKRPSTHPIGKRLTDYTNKQSRSYDPDFTKKIKALAPEWFVPKSERVEQMKRKLLEMAGRGMQKPARGSRLVGLLYRSTNKKSDCHDPDFASKIRRLAPNWFVSKSQPKKELLLCIARDDGPKPKDRDPLGGALRRYTTKQSNSYDPDFTRKIKVLAPHWFVPTSRTNKDLLLDMARKRTPKPDRKTKIGQALVNYTSKTSFVYDPDFTRKIKVLAPQWFRKATL